MTPSDEKYSEILQSQNTIGSIEASVVTSRHVTRHNMKVDGVVTLCVAAVINTNCLQETLCRKEDADQILETLNQIESDLSKQASKNDFVRDRTPPSPRYAF